jgi:hypothetical protein
MKCKESVAPPAWSVVSESTIQLHFIHIHQVEWLGLLSPPLFQYRTGANIENAIEQAETTRQKQVIDVAG